MQRTYIKDLKEKIGKEVLVKGWVHVLRHQGKISFLVLRDKTGNVQCVVLKSDKELFEKVSGITNESVVEIKGALKEERQAPGGMEIKMGEINTLSVSDPNLPIPVVEEKGGGRSGQSTRFDYRWLDLRSSGKMDFFKLWTYLEEGFRRYFLENDFLQLYSPAIMSAPSESGAEVFEVNYFERKAYLAQSPQFYKQMAMASGFDKVFMTGPVFRAEPSFTTRHMTEFTGWDFEFSYIESHHDVMAVEEELLVSGFENVGENMDIKIDVPKPPFPKLTLAEVKEKLKEVGIKSYKDDDISPEEERELYRLMKKETGSDFVWVIDYPITARPFYHMRREDNPKLTKSFDLLYKGLEITTGAQREHRYDVLVDQAKEEGMDVDSLENYLNFFKWGCPPHGGVGIGPGRIVMQMLDLSSVKEATFLPRDVKRITP